jgi:hypothetical protein
MHKSVVFFIFVGCSFGFFSFNSVSCYEHKLFEDTKQVIKSLKSNKGQPFQRQKENAIGQKMIYKTLHSKLQIEQHTTH